MNHPTESTPCQGIAALSKAELLPIALVVRGATWLAIALATRTRSELRRRGLGSRTPSPEDRMVADGVALEVLQPPRRSDHPCASTSFSAWVCRAGSPRS